MQTNKIILTLSILAVGLFAFSLAQSQTFIQSSSGGIHYGSVVCIYKNGVLIEPCHHNLIDNTGKDLIAQSLNGTSASNVVLIAVTNNTSAQAATDTASQGEYLANGGNPCGMTNASGTWVGYGTAGQWNVTNTFTSSCASVTVNGTALYNNSLSNGLANKLFAETTFTSTTLNANDQINVTWGIYIS